MRIIGCGGRDRRLAPLDLAVVAAIHRPEAHPFLAGLRRRLQALEPGFPWGERIEHARHGDASTKDWPVSVDRDFGDACRLLGIPVDPFPADWARYGKGAGPRRNAQMLAGKVYPSIPEATAVVAWPGGAGTADMVAQTRLAGIPVLDLAAHAAALEPFQRWTKEDAWLVRSDRKACLEVQARRFGVGPPIMSGHWMKMNGNVVLTPWCLYVGRTANGLTGHPRLANPFRVRPIGGDTTDVIVHGPNGPERCTEVQALDHYRRHLTALCERPGVAAELEAIARQRRILVCWCGSSKPCHACVIAEFAVGFLAITALRAACPPG